YFVSVNPEKTKLFNDLALSHDFLPFELTKRPVRARFDLYNLNQLGIDRLCAIEGYLASAKLKECAVVVSFGTATTVDAIGTRGRHLGGWIHPGGQTMLDSLAEKTGLLPKLKAVDVSEDKDMVFGDDSATAMRL